MALGRWRSNAKKRRSLHDTRSDLDSLVDISWREFGMLVGESFRRQGYDVLATGLGGKDGVRSNIHAGGTAKAVKVTDRELRLAELIRPKLQADRMFLVGIDIIGSIERKLEIRDEYPGHFTNAALAAM